MDKNLDNLTKLTEFAPLESEEKPQTVGQFFSKFFKFGKNVNDETSNRNSSIIVESTNSKNSPICDKNSDQSSNDVSSSNNSVQFSVDISEGRSLPNVLKRISNLLALKSSGLQAYGDTELRQYWMPDSVSKECYECCERFTTWRRRHHCRVCGQIFCSRCCSQEIPGKIMGCTGDLRVCTYCCKVVLSYLQSPDMGSDLTSDLRALQEDLQVKFGTHSSSIGITNYSDSSSLTVPLTFSNESNNGVNIGCNKSTNIDKSSLSRRKVSVGYQEEKFAEGRFPNSHSTPNEERCRALQSSTSLRSLYEDICKATICNSPGTINKSLSLGTHRYRLRTYPQCVQGSQLVDWLINHNKAASRIQATALGQALLEAGYLENVVESPASSVSNSSSPVSFSDSPNGLYRPCAPSELPFDPPTQDGLYNKQGAPHEPAEPSWVQQIPNDGGTTTDSEAESQPSAPMVSTGGRIPSSSSSFYLDLDLEANTVHLVRPTPENTMSDFLNNDVSNINIHISPKESDSASNVPPNSADREIVPASGWYNLQQLRADNGENEAYCALNEAWKQHENALMMQLLRSEGLSQNWASVIQPLIHEVVNFVRPDLNHDAELMDIREYVRVKTVPGGTTGNKGSESRVIRGIVCSKNVAHRSMQGQRKQPRILLLACPLVYQRNEGRFMSLEPVLMQEHEYLRHATARILALHPNVVLVGRNASRLAQQLLGESGVALATAVKHSVLERLARVSSADIVTSVDASSIGRPWKLATCQEFYTQQFRDDNNGSKTLMFFEGLPNPHLGCTILLRGASKSELKKLKRVTQHLLFARYNWRLEQSFLMDEFAKPPCPKKDTFFGDHLSSKESTPEETVNKCKKINTVEKNSTEIIISDDNIWIHTENDDIQKNVNITENNNSFTVLTDNKLNNNDKKIVISDNIKDEAEKNIKSLNPSNSLQNNINNITKSSVVIDPLQYYEDGIFNNTQQLDVSEAPLSNRFRKALDDTILSISPYLNFNIPFLETEIGRKCKLRKFFPRDIYYSLQFLDTIEKTGVVKCITSNDSIEEKNNNIKLKPAHPFISAKLTSAADSKEVQTMLAHFRACGGRIPHQNINETKSFKHTKHSETDADNSNSKNISVDLRDALDFNNHQRLAVLFCSFSYSSNNAPAFCVNPWIVHMDFYGRNDIALGCFLERYCFRESYVCPSHTCETPMLQHIRRFVHHNGCVHVTLNKLENLVPSEDNKIVMWSWCSKCNTVSSVVPMSNDTWSFSFAKFLELKFHGHMYGRRGKNETCTHSLHHDYCQYFGWKHIVASFKYTPVQLWEISLPSPCLEFHWNPVVQQEMVIDEVKTLALRGHEVYSAILDKLLFYNELEEVPALKLQLQRDQADFKLLIEEAQLKLTSPTLENKKQECSDSTGIHYMIWCLEDSLVRIKHLIAEACETWNAHISELIQIQTKLTKLNKSLSKQNTQSKIDNSISNNPNKPLILHIADDTDVTDIDSPSSPDYNAVDVANASNSVIENLNKIDLLKNEAISSNNSSDVENIKPTLLLTSHALRIHSLDQPDVSEESFEEKNSDSSKRHTRSQSESIAVPFQTEEFLIADNRKESTIQSDKKSVKTILSQLLPSTSANNSIQSPLNSQEHHLLPPGIGIPLVVYENEPSSIIAYALTTVEYRRALDDLLTGKQRTCLSHVNEPSPSPVHKRKHIMSQSDKNENYNELTLSGESKHSGILSFLRSSPSQNSPTGDISSISTSEIEESVSSTRTSMIDLNKSQDLSTDSSKNKSKSSAIVQLTASSHIEIQFQDSTSNFLCRIYCAEQFASLRKAVLSPCTNLYGNVNKSINEYEERYIRSLSRSVQWAARGGKSGSNFSKTKDDRFILKEMSKLEMQLFLDSASNYFVYMEQCISLSQPTLLGKIVGVYKVIYRNASANTGVRKSFLVMENLFYNRQVTHKFDLKGSDRNRLVNIDAIDQDGEIVLLDENLLKMTCQSPLYILPHSKSVLTTAINNDTNFLASQSVMDYSLLVGLDEDSKELVVGIIDYIRTFTWDKKLETMVKKSGILGGQGKLPTIVSPEEYRKRFIAAMHRYFLPVPGRWIGLSQCIDF